jgi:hypothetical protein
LSRVRILVALASLLVLPTLARAASSPAGEGVISGHLLDEATGVGLAGQPVVLRWIPPESARDYPYPWTAMDGSRPRAVDDTSTDGEGRFVFDGLGAGLYQLQVDLPLAGEAMPLKVAGEGTTHALVTVVVGRVATGRVLRPDGTPAGGADVFLSGVEDGKGGNALWQQDPKVRTARDDGTFLLPGLPEGRCWLEAWLDDVGFSAPAPVEDQQSVELVIRDEMDRLFPLDRARFAGVGISVSRDAAGPYVASAREGGAAARAGVVVGDRIVAVDGLETVWMPFAELLMRCRGPEGRPVVLTLVRDGERFDVEIVRELLR